MAKQRKQVAVQIPIEQKKVEGRKCPIFRVSYPHVFEPVDFDGNGDFRYRVTMLFPKSSDLTELKRAAHMAKVEMMGKDKTKWKKDTVIWLNDGDAAQDKGEAYKGHWFVSASIKKDQGKPQIVNARKEPITDSEEFYAGCYAKATLLAFHFAKGPNVGVSFALQNLQKVKDGEPLSAKPRAEESFDVEDDGSGDSNNYDDNSESSDDAGFDEDIIG